MKKNKTILILGASGELAQSFIKDYDNKKNILLFDLKLNKTLKSRYKKNYFNKFTKEFKERVNKSNIIINFIGEIYLTHRMMSKNVLFLKKVLKILNKNKKKLFIHLSTAGVYNYLNLKTKKSYQNKLAYNFYEKTKIDGENTLLDYQKINRNFKLRIIRVAGLIDLKKSNLKINLLKLYKLKFLILLRNKNSYIFYFKKKILLKEILFLMSGKKNFQIIDLIKSETITFFYKKFLRINNIRVFYFPNLIENILKKILIFNIKYLHSNNFLFKYLTILFSNNKIINK